MTPEQFEFGKNVKAAGLVMIAFAVILAALATMLSGCVWYGSEKPLDPLEKPRWHWFSTPPETKSSHGYEIDYDSSSNRNRK